MLQLENQILKLDFDSNVIKQREDSWQSFLNIGLPCKKTENWRYTNLNALYKKYEISQVKISLTPSVMDDILSILNLNTDMCNIVFVDGQLFYADKASGINICSIFSITSNKDKEYRKDALDHINDAAFLGGVFIEIEKNRKFKKPILITYLQTKNSATMVVNYKHNIILQANSECIILDQFIGCGTSCSAVNISSDITLNHSSKCLYNSLKNQESKKLLITHKLAIKVDSEAECDIFQMLSYAILNHIEFYVDLCGKGAKFSAKGTYILALYEKIDSYFDIKHNASSTKSDVFFRGAVNDYASATFNAKAYVNKGLHGIHAMQNNHNIQLSNTSEINTKPELKIYSDDVSCKHGATVGQLDQQALFYLHARGINENDAKILLMEGFFKELIIFLKRDNETTISYLNILDKHIAHLFNLN